MATLPRMHNSKHKHINQTISAPFSTSPRKLQEMSPTAIDGHDITNASGISMKQYEEQLNGLRKENFHLKLRIYFLEEKLGTGSPPAVQGLLEHNVRLQVEVEELRRQLSDKQELLAAAAEAIDVLEQQGSISTDSVETSMNNSVAAKKETESQQAQTLDKQNDVIDDTCGESEATVDYLGLTGSNDGMDELLKLRRENRKALQMIKGCMKKIQQQDKEIKKLKLDKELVYAHISDSQLEKYEEILKCKDEHIKDLESKVRDLQKNEDNLNYDVDAGNLQQLLTCRLQGLAYFLDKLLAHKCVLGEDKKKLAESILEQSLALPVGLRLDESLAGEGSAAELDDSGADVSRALRLHDLTLLLGHHRQRDDSDAWSEPDRRVSLARVGLPAPAATPAAPTPRPRRPRPSHAARSDDGPDAALLDELARLTASADDLQDRHDHLAAQLERYEAEVEELTVENRRLKEALGEERENVAEANRNVEVVRNSLLTSEARAKEIERRAEEAERAAEELRASRLQLQEAHEEAERALRRAADDAALQASAAALERGRAHSARAAAERELDAARAHISRLDDELARLQLQLAARAPALPPAPAPAPAAPPADDDERPTSPDQGIDSDRLSSLEHNDDVTLSPTSLYRENVALKQKLARTKATLADTIVQLNAANMRKRSVQRAICREIHKTHGVLRKARDQFENQS